jgi:hypothetical protein
LPEASDPQEQGVESPSPGLDPKELVGKIDGAGIPGLS